MGRIIKAMKGAVGNGVPAGGDTGNVLVKTSNDDFDTTWGSALPPIPSNTGTFILKAIDGDIQWVAE